MAEHTHDIWNARIIAYLRGDMPEEERKRFEQDLQADAELREEYEQARRVKAATYFVAKETEQLRKEKIRQMWKQAQKKSASRRRWAVVAGVLLLVGLLGLWIYLTTNRQESTKPIPPNLSPSNPDTLLPTKPPQLERDNPSPKPKYKPAPTTTKDKTQPPISADWQFLQKNLIDLSEQIKALQLKIRLQRDSLKKCGYTGFAEGFSTYTEPPQWILDEKLIPQTHNEQLAMMQKMREMERGYQNQLNELNKENKEWEQKIKKYCP